jgi:hypothetical protein
MRDDQGVRINEHWVVVSSRMSVATPRNRRNPRSVTLTREDLTSQFWSRR